MRGFGLAAVTAGILSLAAMAAPAHAAATLLTSQDGYAGLQLDLSAYAANDYYTFTDGPVVLPGNITYTSTNPESVLGHGYPYIGYGLGSNGESRSTLIIGSNFGGVIRLRFDTPVAVFGAGFNYAPGTGPAYIRAFDSSHALIAEYDLTVAAPISTPGEYDAFRFRGIDGGGVGIALFEFTGAYIIAAANGTAEPVTGVPEPTTWGLMILGFGLAGHGVRTRRRAIA